MRRVSRARAGSLAVLLIGVMALTVAAPAPARAADVTFGEAVTSSLLGEPITFSQSFSSAVRPVRVELITRLPDDAGAEVRVASVTGDGPEYRATVEVDEHVRPNTTFLHRLRVVLPDGTTAAGPEGQATVVDDRFDWRSEAGQTVAVHWYDGPDSFGRSALRTAEDAAAAAAGLLGLDDVDRMDYFIYGSTRDLYDALGAGTQEEVGGQYYAPIRTAYADISSGEVDSSWAREVVAHEVAHHVFDQATRNPYHEAPTWLNEGVAVLVSEGGPENRAAELRAAVQDGVVLPLEALTEAFPRVSGPFSLAYAESVSAVSFLVERHGRDALGELARLYRGGASDDEAFQAVTGGSLAEFDDAWQAEIGAQVPPAYGPQPAPAGPLPADWQGGSFDPGGQSSPGATAGAPAATGSLVPTGTPAGATAGSTATPETGVPAGSSGAGGGLGGLWPVLLVVGVLIAGVLAAVLVTERRAGRSTP